MELTKKIPTTDKSQENNHLLRMLDRGIDDMEAGRELPLEDAFRKITELRTVSSVNMPSDEVFRLSFRPRYSWMAS